MNARVETTPSRRQLLCWLAIFSLFPAASLGGVTEVSNRSYKVSLVKSRAISHSKLSHEEVLQHHLAVINRVTGETPDLVFGGSDKVVATPVNELRLYGDRLVVTTETAFAVFSLATGHEELFSRSLGAVVSDTGRYVAYKVHQGRFTPREASSTVVVVLDLASLEATPVFPEGSKIAEGPHGQPLYWKESREGRDSVGEFFWGLADERLLFFVTSQRDTVDFGTSFATMCVVVDLSDGVERSTFARKRVSEEIFVNPEIELPTGRALFRAEAVLWVDQDRIKIVAPKSFWWMRDLVEFTLPSPHPGESDESSTVQDYQ